MSKTRGFGCLRRMNRDSVTSVTERDRCHGRRVTERRDKKPPPILGGFVTS